MVVVVGVVPRGLVGVVVVVGTVVRSGTPPGVVEVPVGVVPRVLVGVVVVVGTVVRSGTPPFVCSTLPGGAGRSCTTAGGVDVVVGVPVSPVGATVFAVGVTVSAAGVIVAADTSGWSVGPAPRPRASRV